jgi:hypothetical protein
MIGAELFYHLINSALLTAIVALFVLWRYRVAVLKGMMRGDNVALPLPLPAPQPRTLQTGVSAVAQGHAWERRQQWRIALAYLAATVLCGLPLAFTYRYLTGLGHTPAEVVLLALIYGFASAPMIVASLALAPRRALAGLLGLSVALAALAVCSVLLQRVLAGRPLGMQQLGIVAAFFQLAAIELAIPALFWLLTWPMRLRGVVPITFAALLLFGLAPFFGMRISMALAETAAGTPWVLSAGLNGVFMLIALPTGWVAWKRLHQLARGYDRKQFSDVQLLARTWWVMLVASVGLSVMTLKSLVVVPLAVCVAVALAFAPVSRRLLAGAREACAQRPPRTLLLLRVFGYTRRTERLFDRIGARWRLFGPVTMIAAPDVAARTIDPGDYLRWLTGRVDELFVTSRADLDARLAALDLAPDPDGRYRVNEFCCRDNTWQATVVELIQRADAVVMDVRGVSRAHRGCEFELKQLAQRLAPPRLVLVIDKSTDREVLQAAFGARLEQVRVIEWQRARDADGVFDALLAAAA